MALFGQFLAIKWVKMAGSKKSPLGSRPSSTQWTRYMYWFSRNDNFENPPPLNTLWADEVGDDTDVGDVGEDRVQSEGEDPRHQGDAAEKLLGVVELEAQLLLSVRHLDTFN